MVVFACNSCGESMKKAQVEKHCMRCRQCNVVSCVDCGKEFWGDEYQQHIKCITEDEKYGGKNYKPKPGANKGELKQELWTQQVQEAINNTKGNLKLRGLLENLKDYPNIPRKKPKFENFVRNSLRVREQWLIDQVWEAMAANIQKPPPPETKDSQKKVENDTEKEENGKAESQSAAESTDATSQDEPERKKSKREKKEERSKKQTKKEKKNKTEQNAEENQPKKNKKRKRDEIEEEDEESVEPVVSKKKKKKKHRDEEKDDEDEAADTSQASVTSPVKPKFSWEQCVLEVLLKNDNELKFKKLRKKVMNEYISCYGDQNTKSEEQLWSKFEKTIRRINGLKVQKERVKLLYHDDHDDRAKKGQSKQKL